jgi:uroporphyrin-III C-methyltransferase
MSRVTAQHRGALVLAAHGSRREPAANALVRRVAESLRGRRLFDEVAVAFHQGEPGFDTILDEIGSDEVTVVPFFTSAGHYSDIVLPEALTRNRRYSEIRLRQTRPIGDHPAIGALVARRVAELTHEHRIDRGSVSLALVGHGTRRHPQSRSTTLDLADRLRRRRVAGEVLTAFLDDDPPVEGLLESAVLPNLVVIPFLIGGGSHVLDDIPRRLATGDRRRLIVDQPIGTYPGMLDIIVDLARRNAPPRHTRRGPASPILPTSARSSAAGTVDLVGGGPGDPGLITVRGLQLLRRADVVIHDRLIGAELLGEVGREAILIDVGKGPGHAPYSQAEINDLLVEHARTGKSVVRLKGGDPFVFGRGSEEMEACRLAGVRVRVVPGVTSAIAAPAAAGIPVTARGIASSFTVLTGQLSTSDQDPAVRSGQARPVFPVLPILPILRDHTLVILMGRSNLAALATELIVRGRDPSTPAACIQSATTPNQRVTRATLATIAEAADRDGLVSPVVTVIGDVAAIGNERLLDLEDPRRAGGQLDSLDHASVELSPLGAFPVQTVRDDPAA